MSEKFPEISTVMITKNEEPGIVHTRSHLTEFTDVVVVDSQSEARTVAMAEWLGARVVDFVMAAELSELPPELRERECGAYGANRYAGEFVTQGHKVAKRILVGIRATRRDINDSDAPGIPELELHYQASAMDSSSGQPGGDGIRNCGTGTADGPRGARGRRWRGNPDRFTAGHTSPPPSGPSIDNVQTRDEEAH